MVFQHVLRCSGSDWPYSGVTPALFNDVGDNSCNVRLVFVTPFLTKAAVHNLSVENELDPVKFVCGSRCRFLNVNQYSMLSLMDRTGVSSVRQASHSDGE